MKTKRNKITRQNIRLETNTLATAVRRSFGVGSAAVMLSMSPLALSGGPFGPVVELSELDGSNGFVLNGVVAGDFSGGSVSGAGDINGDGVDDLIIGAYFANESDNGYGDSGGESYVVFGGSGVGSTGAINLSGLNGTDGFVLNGAGTDTFSGHSVSGAGDINGDGVDDLVIGGLVEQAYVVFGGGDVSGGRRG